MATGSGRKFTTVVAIPSLRRSIISLWRQFNLHDVNRDLRSSWPERRLYCLRAGLAVYFRRTFVQALYEVHICGGSEIAMSDHFQTK